MNRLQIISTVIVLITVPILTIIHAQVRPKAEAHSTKLWAAISVPEPIFQVGHTDKLQVYFAVVNDGDTAVNPNIGSSHFFLNGVEPRDWNFIINNGIRMEFFTSLPPGRSLLFTYQLGDRYFAKPGLYTVRWEGEHFRTPGLTFRVVPQL